MSKFKRYLFGLAILLSGTTHAGTWSHSAWTNDANSGIGTASVPPSVQANYTVAVNMQNAAVAVNGISFGGHATSGTNFNMAGAFATHPGGTAAVTGASATLAAGFLYDGNPRTVTLTNLLPGEKYETSFFAFGWEASGRTQTFASAGDSYVVDQDAFGNTQGIRVVYNFKATAATQAITITPVPGGAGTFHMSALANRLIPVPPATITLFGTNVAGSTAVISDVVANSGTITWTVPFGTNLATLAPTFTISPIGSTCNQTSGSVPTPDFGSGPVTYTATSGATVNNYAVTAVQGPPSSARDILTFNANLPGTSSSITSTGPNTGTIVVYLPQGSPGAIASTLAPSFTLSTGATCNRVSGVKPTPNLSMGGSVIYTVTAQDGTSTKDYAVTVQRTGWSQVRWTGDADSGIGGTQADYTVAVNMGTADTTPAIVNGITFSAHVMSNANFVMTGTSTNAGRVATNVTGDSDLLAKNFTHGSNRVLTLNNLTPGTTYETSFYSYGWDATPGRTQRFESNGDSFTGDGSAYGDGNGARIYYTFVAATTSKVMTVTQTGTGPFHISALGNRIAPPPSTPGDTDADDLADSWEIDKAGNLTDLTGLLIGPGPGFGSGDFDDDGLIDAQEYVLRFTYPTLNPLDADSDDDGLSDGAEIFPTAPRVATNPTVADTDGDGLNDFIENNSGTFVNAGNPGTNPASVDSDNDQYPDSYEIGQGGNPVLGTNYPTILPAGIALGVVTDEASTGITNSPTFTHKISGGSPATLFAGTADQVVLDVLDTTATPPNFTWNPNTGGKNIIGPGINNGTWVPATGNVTGAGNLQMFGTFTYSGGGGPPGNSQVFTLSALEPGLSYEMRIFIRKWDDGTVRPQYLKFTNGAQVTNYYILEDRPELVLGGSNREAAYYIQFTYVAQATSMSLEAKVANVSSGNGSFHLYGLTNRSTSLPAPLDFNSITRLPNGNMKLDIRSRPGRVYGVSFSTTLAPGSWIELTDNVPATGTSTIYTDEVTSEFDRVFFRVDDLTP